MAYIKEVFKFLKYFSFNEKDYMNRPNAWGDGNRMCGLLLRILDEWRAEVGSPCYVHAGFETNGHASHSEHAYGTAVDVDFRGVSLWKAYSALQKVLGRYNLQSKVGIGIYFWWVSGKTAAKPGGGFHLDLRGFELTWYSIKQGEYIYDKQKAINLMKAKAGVK
jgi:hypothetical protein